MIEPSSTRIALVISVLFFCFADGFAKSKTPEYDEQQTINRLEKMPNDLFRPKADAVTLAYIKRYMSGSKSTASIIMGRANLYLPMFEYELAVMDAPSDLKYLPILESALNVHAVSHAGAGGLWQIMPGTGRMLGLKATSYWDERFDPKKATRAAISYLKTLHSQYGDWELALAAYNGGPGRVNAAIKRARTNDFWKLRSFLPRESANYVPAYMAAAYLGKHYREHDVEARELNIDFYATDDVKVYSGISFESVSQITGVPVEDLAWLNPQYRRKLVPDNEEGISLKIPSRVTAVFLAHLQGQNPDKEYLKSDFTPIAAPVESQIKVSSKKHIESSYDVTEGETLESIASLLEFTPEEIREWNNLPADSLLQVGQTLKLLIPIKKEKPYRPEVFPVEAIGAATLNVKALYSLQPEKTNINAFNLWDSAAVFTLLTPEEPISSFQRITQNVAHSISAIIPDKKETVVSEQALTVVPADMKKEETKVTETEDGIKEIPVYEKPQQQVPKKAFKLPFAKKAPVEKAPKVDAVKAEKKGFKLPFAKKAPVEKAPKADAVKTEKKAFKLPFAKKAPAEKAPKVDAVKAEKKAFKLPFAKKAPAEKAPKVDAVKKENNTTTHTNTKPATRQKEQKNSFWRSLGEPFKNSFSPSPKKN